MAPAACLTLLVLALAMPLGRKARLIGVSAAGLAAGVALAFARALGEFGSVLIFAGGLPDTQVSSVFIRTQVESGNTEGAAAVSMVLLLASLLCLLAISLIQRRANRHDEQR